MADFKPFKALRPPRDKAHLVGSRSYISYTEQDLIDKLAKNPFTFLHVIMPEGKYNDFKNLSVEQRFGIVKNEYENFVAAGNLVQDKKEAFYIYRQTKFDQEFIGIIGGIAAKDYDSGVIKKHEQTLEKREHLFKNYLDITSFNAEPVLLAYDDLEEINNFVNEKIKKRPEYDYYTTNAVKHEMWIVRKKKHQRIISQAIDGCNNLYIADGHHRCASSAILARECEDKNDFSKSHFMAMLIPKSSLHIYEYNRVVKNTTGLSKKDLFNKISEVFDIEKVEDSYIPSTMHAMSMYIDKDWYKLEVKTNSIPEGITAQLDTHILTELILKPILDIEDIRNDERVHFVSGTLGSGVIKKIVDSGDFDIGFGMFPVSFEQLKAVSDAGLTMPPKSTWIEPKLRSGLTIFKLSKD